MIFAFSLFVLMFTRSIADGPSIRESYLLHIAKGDEFYHSFDNDRALVEYERAYAIAADSFATLERLTSIYNDFGRLHLRKDTSAEFFYKKAFAYADSLKNRFPDRAESHFWLALCEGSLIPFLGTREKIHTAHEVQREASRAIEIDSGFAQAYVILGIFQREASNISWFERMIANVVFGANFSGSLSVSETLLRKSVALNPSNSYGYYELYWTYRAMNDSTHAIQSLRTLLTIAPTNAREQLQRDEAKKQLTLSGGKP